MRKSEVKDGSLFDQVPDTGVRPTLRLMRRNIPRDHHYSVRVDGSVVVPSFAQLEASYGKGNVSELWDPKTRDICLHESLPKAEREVRERVFHVKAFDRTVQSDDVIAWARANGYRVPYPFEREAFRAEYPRLQCDHWIIDLGSYVITECQRYIPVLDGSDQCPRLIDEWYGGTWHSALRFLLVLN